jgi:hypothetical protein
MFSGKHGSFRIYTASTLTIIFKYENIKLKNKECPAEEAQHLNYRIKSLKGHQYLMRLSL